MNDIDPNEELQNALDEIKNTEKDISMMAMIAETLFEKNNEMNQKYSEQQSSIAHAES